MRQNYEEKQGKEKHRSQARGDREGRSDLGGWAGTHGAFQSDGRNPQTCLVSEAPTPDLLAFICLSSI